MIQHGSSTVYEMYPNRTDGKVNPKQLTRSHCHAWSAAPGYFLTSEVLGVRRESIGWKKLSIAPTPIAGLTWAKGSVPLPNGGRIDVSWSLAENGKVLELSYDAPEDHEVEVIAPEGYRLKVRGKER